MSVEIPEQFKDLLTRQKRAFAFLALVKGDGSPQVTPIWFDYDGSYFIFNTARGRLKDKIMKKHPVVAFDIVDPADSYRYIQVSGPVAIETEEGAADGILDMAEKYHGKREYTIPPGQVRVIYKILPEHIQAH